VIARIPWRLIGYVLAAVLALAALNHFAKFVPFTPQWSARQAEAKAERLEGHVASLEREATGNAEITNATQKHHGREVALRELSRQAEIEARTAPDAETPLDPDRVARIRAADNRLCIVAPSICPDSDPAGSGADPVPVADPAQ
jgi:hypothetical protein